ncbi:protein AF-9 [Teleopsis dalmanni]|uniref:protein AF-9 n=1 Tax=Teleopsis dalmanni TaxID=139649 RepID=UPI0018CD5FE4|nr:protein AF-9 [Teleopsis dalmanni]
MAVKVQFEIGHTAKLRSKKTPEGFTHDWELYVQGVNKVDISTFVDKVVFNLHDSFPKPKRVCKETPYVIQESGYAGFLLPIEIYFRNRDEPKRVQFTYDLDLQQTGPPHHRSEIKKFIFESPSEEFRPKLLKGGGVPVSGVIGSGINLAQSNTSISDEGMVSKPKLSCGESSSKKHRSRTDDGKPGTFANLFGTPITKNATKLSPESKSNLNAKTFGAGSQSSTLNPNNSSGSSTFSKEKFIKDKSNGAGNTGGSNFEKHRDKTDKKEKYKLLSPHKDGRGGVERKSTSNDSSKHEKRIEEKLRKDKLREKDRERSREKGNSNLIMKRGLSPRSSLRDGGSSPKRATTPVSGTTNSRFTESRTMISTANKFDSKDIKAKEQISSSSGKKFKKDRKDRDKDREKDKEKREEHREKHRSLDSKTKDERTTVIGGNMPISSTIRDEKEAKATSASNTDNKKYEKEVNIDALKQKGNIKQIEKDTIVTSNVTPTSISSTISTSSASNDKKIITNNSNGEKDKKSHKHKKKDKNKDKEKERDKDKDKEKEKEKGKEKEKFESKLHEKLAEPTALLVTNDVLKLNTNSNQSNSPVDISILDNTTNTKKSQGKEKKPKDKSNRDEKRQKEIDIDIKGKISKNSKQVSTPTSATNSASPLSCKTNINLSDDNSANSPANLLPSKMQIDSPTAIGIEPNSGHVSDSSNSSFPDLTQKSSSNMVTQASIVKNAKSPLNKEFKQSSAGPKETKQINNFVEQAQKPAESSELEKIEEIGKDDKKRRRNSIAVNTFVEPTVKRIKKETNKATTRDKSRSPSLRGTRCNSVDVNNGPFLAPPSNSVANSIASSPATSTTTTTSSNNVPLAPPVHPASPALANDAVSNAPSNVTGGTTTVPTATLPTEYLNELQELHQKIMTLQDNEELQQVVEMIAATGCYEITAKTFDFDLCKLDRNTVQRLQDFFATSVS